MAQTPRRASRHLALVTGHFSNDVARATFGDTEALHVVTTWLTELGIPYDVTGTAGNGLHGLDLHQIDPNPYTIFIFVCGPWVNSNNWHLERCRHAFKIGANLSLEAGATHSFDPLLPRDLPGESNSDIVFAAPLASEPLAGLILAHEQSEYGPRQRHTRARGVFDDFLRRDHVVAVPLDPLHMYNIAGLERAEQFDNIVRQPDVVLTTRLHGMVFALKNGIPVVAVDAMAGWAKVTKQAAALGWPLVFDGATVTEAEIQEAVARCLNGELQPCIAQLQERARQSVQRMHARFHETLAATPIPPVGPSLPR